jgi:hypothetical protein
LAGSEVASRCETASRPCWRCTHGQDARVTLNFFVLLFHAMSEVDRLELEPATGLTPRVDRRRRMDEPLPVKLVAVDDVRLPAPAGVEVRLDEFYVGLLGFERVPPETELVYRAENFVLRFDVEERPVEHDSLRPQGIEIVSLAEAELRLIEGECEYVRQRGVLPGSETIVLRDPAGNWVELVELRSI